MRPAAGTAAEGVLRGAHVPDTAPPRSTWDFLHRPSPGSDSGINSNIPALLVFQLKMTREH